MSDVADKWGKKVAERGFAQVPNYLLLINQFLDEEHTLSPAELLILIQLSSSWWKKAEMPFPSMSTLAARCGVSSRQVQRAINNLENIGLIGRVKRRENGIVSSNAYNMEPLVQVLSLIANQFPNEFPRKVSKETIEKISSSLSAETAKKPRRRLVMPRKKASEEA